MNNRCAAHKVLIEAAIWGNTISINSVCGFTMFYKISAQRKERKVNWGAQWNLVMEIFCQSAVTNLPFEELRLILTFLSHKISCNKVHENFTITFSESTGGDTWVILRNNKCHLIVLLQSALSLLREPMSGENKILRVLMHQKHIIWN